MASNQTAAVQFRRPWGVPNEGFTPEFPSHFPPKVVEVIRRIPLQEGPIVSTFSIKSKRSAVVANIDIR